MHLQSLPINGDHVSRCYHSLVHLILSEGQNGDESEQDEAWRVLNRVLDLPDSVAKVRCNQRAIGNY